MKSIERIQQEIANLSSNEIAQLHNWLVQTFATEIAGTAEPETNAKVPDIGAETKASMSSNDEGLEQYRIWALESQDKLDALLEKITDEDGFLAFLLALSEDWLEDSRRSRPCTAGQYSSSPNGWENGSIDSFLEAAHAWGETWRGGPGDASENPWRRAASIIYAGKHYE